MDASFLDRNVNEGFSGTHSWHAHPHLPYFVDIGGLMHAVFVGTKSLLLLTRHAE